MYGCNTFDAAQLSCQKPSVTIHNHNKLSPCVSVRGFVDWAPGFSDWCQDEWIQSTKPGTRLNRCPLVVRQATSGLEQRGSSLLLS
jgi:hypothetical protein